MDNRNKERNTVVDDVINDDNPIDEETPPTDPDNNEETPDENEDQNGSEEAEDDGSEEQEEDILSDDEEIDEETGEVKKKKVQTKQQNNTPSDAERLREQRREAVILNEQNKQLTESLSKINEVKEPTEEELIKAARIEGFEWDDMDNFSKSMFKKGYIQDQKLSIVNSAVQNVKNIDEWANKVDTFLTANEREQKDKALIGKEAQFRTFAMIGSHRGVSMDILVKAFLHDLPKVNVKQKGGLMLTRGGGAKVEKKDNLKDADYVSIQRKNSPRAYMEAAKKGKINIEI